MNEICRRIWDRDLNIKKWALINCFNYHTCLSVINNRRGKWRAGKAKKIRDALISQGFANVEDFNSEAQP